MKKRKTRFNDGGLNPYQGDDVDPFSAVRNEEGGTDPRKEGAASEVLYDETTGKELKTRRNLETGDYYSTEPVTRKAEPARAAPKAPAIKDVPGSGRGSMAGRRASDDIMYVTGGGRGRMAGRTAADEITYTPGRASGRAEIPVDSSMRGPAKQFSPAMEMSDTGRALATTLGATGGAGPSIFRGASSLPKVASTAAESAKGMAAPAARAAKEGLEVARTSGPKAGLETAQSTLRGMKSRAEIQAKRGARQTAEEMEKAKPVLQARKSDKAERAARTRRSEEDSGIEFSRGGSASSRGDGCAKRGKTKGKLY